MFTIEEFREMLGEEGEKFTDTEVKRIRDVQYDFVSAIFDQWLKKRNQPKMDQTHEAS